MDGPCSATTCSAPVADLLVEHADRAVARRLSPTPGAAWATPSSPFAPAGPVPGVEVRIVDPQPRPHRTVTGADTRSGGTQARVGHQANQSPIKWRGRPDGATRRRVS
jgi:hypothetical protein